MLDRFYRAHRKVIFRDDWRESIRDQGFKRAEQLARADIPLPDRSFIEGSRSIGDNAALYSLAVRRAIKNHLGSTFRQPDDLLLEFVVLSKWLQALADAEGHELITARSALGSMIQKGLTQLLCDIDLNQWWRLHKFGFVEGLDADRWQINIAGASAAAYVLMALTRRENEDASVFLPTAHEDVDFGIDLLWIEDRACHAVSVKCVGGQEEHVLAWHVTQKPPRNLTDRLSDDKRRIFLGAKQFASQEERPCEPVLVHVGKPNGGPIRLNRDWDKLTWPDQILDTIRRRTPVDLELAR